MKPMTGEIGKLSLNGEQVGGFKYWTAIQNRKTLQTKVRASKFWLFREIKTNKLQADFYYHLPDGDFKLVYSTGVTVDLPECELDKMITKTISMDLGTFDWLQGIAK